jgi:aryl-alcohol dehydrogenase-like predicted oxidoreductase
VLGRDEVTSVTIGARSETQLMDNLKAGQLVLPAELREQLDKVSQPEKPYPYWMQQFHDKDRVLV